MKKAIVLNATLIAVILTVAFAGISTNQNLAIENKELQDLIENIKNQQPVLVFHVSEKGEEYAYARFPNATQTYNQILQINNNYDVLLLPEYKGNLDTPAELNWIAENFGGPQGVPIMLDVFGGGEQNTPTPQLTLDQITKACKTANVEYLRIAEVLSWHIEKERPFPTSYLNQILEYAKTHNLRVFWTEWKDDYPDKNIETFSAIQKYIQGYEDIVTVSFSTNSQELEPADAYLKLRQTFTNWGTSIQPWYWNTTRNRDLMDMPASLMLEHAFTAKGLGAKIIQFEPYWYFFDNGEINKNLELILTNLVRQISATA